MIPKQLTIQGLYSYQQKQTIDFTALTDARLFGIFGQVGSGKSTILEAITFAIYGKTDRLNLAGDNRNYNMMNLKSDTFLIEFIFSAGNNHNLYMATAKSRRNKKKFEDVKTIERGAYKMVNDQWEPIPEPELENVIGLTYDNFRRTIIIPQGKFQEFLQLGNRDRTQMMKELFNLKAYDLYFQVTSLETKNSSRKQYIEGQMQELVDVQPERIDSLKKELNEQLHAAKNLEVQLDQKRKEETEFQRLKVLTDRKLELEKQLQHLVAQKVTIEQTEKQLKDYQYCQVHFKVLLDSETELKTRIGNLENSIRNDQESLKSVEETLKGNQHQLKEIQPELEKKDSYLHQADDFEIIAMISGLIEKMKKLDERIRAGKTKIKENNTTLEQLQLEQTDIEKNLIHLNQKLPDVNVLAEVSKWHNTNNSFRSTHKELQTEAEEQKKKHEILLQEVTNAYAQPPFEGAASLKSPVDGLEWLQQKSAETNEQLTAIEAHLSELRVKEKLHHFSSELKDGKPCPLCGSVDHPSILDSENVDEELKRTQLQQKRLLEELKMLNEMDRKLHAMNDKLQISTDTMQATEDKLKKVNQNIQEHQHRFTWDKYQTEEQLNAAYELYNQMQKKIKAMENKRAEAQKNLETARKNKEYFASLLEEIKRDKVSKETEKNTLVKQLKMLQFQDYLEVKADDLQQKAIDLRKKATDLATKHEQLTKIISELQQQYGNIKGKIEANQQYRQQEIQNQEKLNKKIEAQLDASKWQHLDQVIEILQLQLDVEKTQAELNNYHQEVSNAETKQNEINSEIDRRTYDADKHGLLKRELEERSEMLVKINQETGRIRSEINQLATNLEKLQKLRKEHEEVLTREEDLKTLKSLFKGNGFVNFVSSVYLQNICNMANDRFQKMTRQTLSLELTDDNNFQVRDFMNGGKVRNIKTLSGGQTFQASLALALALADNIQQMNGADENFFFLDEGFGSLDKDSLNVVFDTLKSLRQENRIVGVISHVDDMQQEISTYLKIENHDEKGSLIHESWKM